MAPKNDGFKKNSKVSKGAWTAEEDLTLAQYIEIHGPRRWKTVALKAGLNRCGKSCRLRWLNYLRPNIKRGNISDAEEDLILRLHKLLGNRWSLIAGRLPGRTDNEIKNYWHSHLSKKIQASTVLTQQTTATSLQNISSPQTPQQMNQEETRKRSCGSSANLNFDINEFFDLSIESSYSWDWVNKFLDPDQDDMCHLAN